jgi:hypothetical protein
MIFLLAGLAASVLNRNLFREKSGPRILLRIAHKEVLNMQVIITLDLEKNPVPDADTGMSEAASIKHEVYAYLRDLMEDGSLDFSVPGHPELEPFHSQR